MIVEFSKEHKIQIKPSDMPDHGCIDLVAEGSYGEITFKLTSADARALAKELLELADGTDAFFGKATL